MVKNTRKVVAFVEEGGLTGKGDKGTFWGDWKCSLS